MREEDRLFNKWNYPHYIVYNQMTVETRNNFLKKFNLYFPTSGWKQIMLIFEGSIAKHSFDYEHRFFDAEFRSTIKMHSKYKAKREVCFSLYEDMVKFQSLIKILYFLKMNKWKWSPDNLIGKMVKIELYNLFI